MRGAAWIATATSVRLAGALVVQVALGLFFDEQDFGLWALTLTFTTFGQLLADGGVRVVASRLRAPFHVESSRLLGASLVLSTTAAVVVVAVSPIVADVYGAPEIPGIARLVAVSIPAGSFVSVYLGLLQSQGRFGRVAGIEIASFLARSVTAVVLARGGLGAHSLAWGTLAAVGVEVMLCTAALAPSAPFPTLRNPWTTIRGLLWPMGGSAVTNLGSQIDYVALGLVASSSVVGAYFFAYRLTIQMVSVIVTTARKVAVPRLSRLGPGEDSSMLHRTALLAGAPLILGLGLVFPALDELLWSGRWSATASAVFVLSLAMPALLLALCSDIALQAAGRFRMWTGLSLGRAIPIGIAAAWSGSTFGTLSSISATIAVGIVVGSIASTLAVSALTGRPDSLQARQLVFQYVAWSGMAIAVRTATQPMLDYAPPWQSLAGLASAWLVAVVAMVFLLHRETILQFRRMTARRDHTGEALQ